MVTLLLIQLFWSSALDRANVDFVGQVTPDQFSIPSSTGCGTWGFSDPAGTPYVVMATEQGTAVFDMTDPANPVEIGMIAGLNQSNVRDVQVYIFASNPDPYEFVARIYVACEESVPGMEDGGFQVIDASDVPNSIAENPHTFLPPGDPGFTTIHGMALGTKPTGFMGYIFGSDRAGGGIVALDLGSIGSTDQPLYLGEWDGGVFVTDLYLGGVWADPTFDGMEMGIAFAGTSFYVVDLTDFYDGNPSTNSPVTIPGYNPPPGMTNNHTGWVTEDGRYLIACDQGDEPIGSNTALRVFDLADLTTPTLVHTWVGGTQAIDHHALISGNYLYLANATAGLVFFDITNPTNLSPHGDYDTFPLNDDPVPAGAWESYYFSASGILALSDRDGGLILLDPVVPEDRCRDFDVEGDGFDVDDFQTRLPFWGTDEDLFSLILLIRCL